MKIYPIISLSADSNTYILEDEKICIIDPGYTSEHLKRIISVLENETVKFPDFIINTHCHYDHIANCKHFKGIKIFMYRNDGEDVMKQNNEKILSYLFGMKVPEISNSNIKFVKDEEVINLGKTKLKILHTPGHTSGSISVYEEKTKSLFSGDLVFSNGTGRTDLKTGNFNDLKNSIDKILNLDFETVYPGHGKTGNYNDVKAIRKFI